MVKKLLSTGNLPTPPHLIVPGGQQGYALMTIKTRAHAIQGGEHAGSQM